MNTIHTGFGDTDGLSMVDDAHRHFRAADKARAANLQPCAHCGRGITTNNRWHTLANLTTLNHFAHPNTDPATLPEGNWQLVTLGSECAKHLPAEYRTN